jgi:hypothetical protein
MGRPERRGEVSIRRSPDGRKCDVIVAIGDHEMVVQLPDYNRAVRWAEMEAKAYGITGHISETFVGSRLRQTGGSMPKPPTAP